MTDNLKLCKDCKHLSAGGFNLCNSPQNGVSFLDGKPRVVLAQVSRMDKIISLDNYSKVASCGMDAKFFEPKPFRKSVTLFENILKFFGIKV
jgi:hypothetical protein